MQAHFCNTDTVHIIQAHMQHTLSFCFVSPISFFWLNSSVNILDNYVVLGEIKRHLICSAKLNGKKVQRCCLTSSHHLFH